MKGQEVRIMNIATKLFRGELLEEADFIPYDSCLTSYICFAEKERACSRISIDRIHDMVQQATFMNFQEDYCFKFMSLFSFYFIGRFAQSMNLDLRQVEAIANACASSLSKQGVRMVDPVMLSSFARTFYQLFIREFSYMQPIKYPQKVLGWS